VVDQEGREDGPPLPHHPRSRPGPTPSSRPTTT
jgi:hypothetical protein